jgi:GT2 family glycosyltransferase
MASRVNYRQADVEITEPLLDVQLSPEECGIAVVVRRTGRPVAFVMAPCAPGALVAAAQLDRLIGRANAVGIVRAALTADFAASRPVPAATARTISVVVCTRDHPVLLQRCLDSIVASAKGDAEQSIDAAPMELLVVDNAPSDDATRAVVEAWGDRVRYVREPAAGLDFARNRALREATGEIVAFLDDDVVADAGYIGALRDAWREDPDAGCITGLVLPYALETRAQVRFEERGGFRRGFQRRRWRGPTLEGNSLYPFGAGIFGTGCNMSLRRELALSLGGFDIALDTGPPLPGGGDLDMFFQVVRAGWPLVYAPGVLVFHEHRREHAELRYQYYTWGLGSTAFLAKWYPLVAPADRRRIRRFFAWWFGLYQAGGLLRGVAGRRGRTVDLALAELVGGVVGLGGEYRRSQRRVARIAADVVATESA